MSASVLELLPTLPAGQNPAMDELTPALYRDLRQIASRHLSGERRNHTLQPTALVHEAYLKLATGRERQFADDVHFLAIASRVMRQVLVDYARSRSTLKRDSEPGKGRSLIAALQVSTRDGLEAIDLIALDDALTALAIEDETLARLVEMRYFGGMTAEESAEELGISVHVIRHDLRYAQAWLRRRMSTKTP